MPTSDRLPESWRGTRRDPRLPDTELAVTTDDDHVIFFDWPDLDAYVRASRECCVELGDSGSVE